MLCVFHSFQSHIFKCLLVCTKKPKQQAVSSAAVSSVWESLPHFFREVIASSFSFLSLRHLVIASSIYREWRKAAILEWNTNARDLNFNTKIWESGIVDSVIMNDCHLPLRALCIQRLRQRCSGCKISSVFVLSSSMSRIVEPEQDAFGPLILPLCPAFLYRCLHSLILLTSLCNILMQAT